MFVHTLMAYVYMCKCAHVYMCNFGISLEVEDNFRELILFFYLLFDYFLIPAPLHIPG